MFFDVPCPNESFNGSELAALSYVLPRCDFYLEDLLRSRCDRLASGLVVLFDIG